MKATLLAPGYCQRKNSKYQDKEDKQHATTTRIKQAIKTKLSSWVLIMIIILAVLAFCFWI
jgi:hypothetical protein